MSESQRIQATREMYRAYQDGDREVVERLLSDTFEFFSPPDPGIDREKYFERCWPNSQTTAKFDFVRLIESEDEVFVTYEATREDGSRFRNTEVMTFAGPKLAKVEVYFGWNLE